MDIPGRSIRHFRAEQSLRDAKLSVHCQGRTAPQAMLRRRSLHCGIQHHPVLGNDTVDRGRYAV